MATRGLRRKRLSYTSPAGGTLADHTAHWKGFTFSGGPVIVRCRGPMGIVQVWAATEAEGRRVVAHAAAISGVTLTGNPDVEWFVGRDSSGRSGTTRTFKTADTALGIEVSVRQGPLGKPKHLQS